jgi:tetratricopeptide (TPR) repeat protein
MLALAEDTSGAARERFELALAMHPKSGRAMLGLALRFADAASTLERAAELLQTHAGAWVAAGWAHLFNRDLTAARERFERAAQIDRGFAEAPSGLAVVSFHEQRFDEAQRQVKEALRLNTNSPSAVFAQSLLAAHAGQQQAATDMIQAVLNRPLGADGRTFAQAMARKTSRLAPRKLS